MGALVVMACPEARTFSSVFWNSPAEAVLKARCPIWAEDARGQGGKASSPCFRTPARRKEPPGAAPTRGPGMNDASAAGSDADPVTAMAVYALGRIKAEGNLE